mmetsp:Transcript_14970/g.20936  ORF Transcript_14970/g.20936 Transcript_14970/m.20936 type:complete len:646 (-) Transcript_14970:92-2029(-)
MGKGKPQKNSLGRTLYKSRFGPANRKNQVVDPKYEGMFTTDIDPDKEKAQRLQSVTQMDDFEELMNNAMLEEKEFVAEKQNTVVITSTTIQTQAELTEKQLLKEQTEWNSIPIPRRPHWDENTTAEELHKMEKQSFLEWRRGLSELENQNHQPLTPFEKNLEVWRQLWRVIEKCDVVVQIVDARNPLLFRSIDLEKYVKEISERKKNVLVLNKADLLSKEQRKAWSRYFLKTGTEFIFFSANEAANEDAKETANLMLSQKAPSSESDTDDLSDLENVEHSDDEEGPEDIEHSDDEEQEEIVNQSANPQNSNEATDQPQQSPEFIEEKSRVYSKRDFLQKLREFKKLVPDSEWQKNDDSEDEYGPRRLLVGMVGYPNVGKSSTINVLVGSKKVAVAPQPGKTKHFQTILIDDDICLCDCPGLVFPTFMTTKADMICNGLLSIDHMTEYVAPMTLVCHRIARKPLERLYGIVLPKSASPNDPPNPHQLLQAYAFVRGWMTVHGMPNESQAARVFLKDYVKGKLLFVNPPPNCGISSKEFNKHNYDNYNWEDVSKEDTQQDNNNDNRTHKSKKKKKANKKRNEPTLKEEEHEDKAIFAQSTVKANTKGRKGQANFTRVQQQYYSPIPIATLKQIKAQQKAATQSQTTS